MLPRPSFNTSSAVVSRFIVATARDPGIARHGPIQSDQPQQTVNEPSRLPLWHTEKDVHGQNGLDPGIAELGLATAPDGRRRCPNHLGIKPDRQQLTLLQRVIVRRPIRGLVLRRPQLLMYPSYHAGFIKRIPVTIWATKPPLCRTLPRADPQPRRYRHPRKSARPQAQTRLQNH